MDTTTSTVAVTPLLAVFGLKVTDVLDSLACWVAGIGAVWLLARSAGGDEGTVGEESLGAFGLWAGRLPLIPGTPR